MNSLHPGVKWVYRKKTYFTFLPIIVFITIIGYSAIFLKILMSLLVMVIIIGEIYSRMSYNRFFYEITNEGVKIEQGIIWKKYTSIPYERVQNVDITRGIIARMFGFSTVEIETAGQSGMRGNFQVRWGGRRRQEYKSEGHLPGVSIEDAENIRAFVMKKIKHTRESPGV